MASFGPLDKYIRCMVEDAPGMTESEQREQDEIVGRVVRTIFDLLYETMEARRNGGGTKI